MNATGSRRNPPTRVRTETRLRNRLASSIAYVSAISDVTRVFDEPVEARAAQTTNQAALAGMCKLKSNKLCTSMPQQPRAAPNRMLLA